MTERKKLDKINIANKFNYILDSYISGEDAKKAFGYTVPSYITRLRNPKHTATLNNLHIQLLEHLCGIPKEVFDNKVEFNTAIIDMIIKKYAHKKLIEKRHSSTICENLEKSKIFCKNEKLFENLKGVWYAYLYPSNPSSSKKDEGIWIVQTIIDDNYSVVDEYNNHGILQISDHQSLILKKSYEYDDLTIIRFQNRQVSYGIFKFIIMSTQNGSENEMVNFGFYSREKYTPKIAKEILGDIDKVQLKLDLEFNDRVISKVIIK